jgi:hypothetical protein
MATSPRTVRVLVWNVSADAADFWFSAFSWLLVVAAILVGIATYGVTIMGSAKERFADERISANEAETARAIAESDAAKEGVAQSNAEAARANEHSKRLEIELEKERGDRLKLEARLAPRRISGEAAGYLVAALSETPAPGTIRIVSAILDQESTDFADDLAAVIGKTQWKGVRISLWTRPIKGVAIATTEGSVPPSAAVALSGALDVAGISHVTTTISAADLKTIPPGFRPGALYLLVGTKP